MWQGRGVRAPESVPRVQPEQDCRPYAAGVVMITEGWPPTGIGSHFDDSVHQALGTARWNGSVYHFTVVARSRTFT